MPSGVYKRTPEHNAANSKAKTGVPRKPFTLEHCANMSKMSKGVPKSPEHIAAVIKGQEESGANEAMRGGNDILKHHYIYDHANPEKYTMKITRSKHAKIHMWMRRSGIKVPHINVTEENKDIFKSR